MATSDISVFQNLLRAGARARRRPPLDAGNPLSARLAALHANHQIENLQRLAVRRVRESGADVLPRPAEVSPEAREHDPAAAGRDAPT
jgi:hypothetical protein